MLFCDIIVVMMKRMLFILPMLACLVSPVARANWEYDGTYARDGYYQDDGRRFIILIRGGISNVRAKMANDIGMLRVDYYNDNGVVFPCYGVSGGSVCNEYEFLGTGNIGTLPMTKNYNEVSFVGGVAIGWVLPWTPQWRFQVDWDYLSENEYNTYPAVSGNLELVGGSNPNVTSIQWETGNVLSTVTTNVFSTMAIRDFYKGWQKPLRKFIPYAGFGLGYADTSTVLNLSDATGDLSGSFDLQQFGELDDNGILQFYSSTKNSSNLAGTITFGFSYGVSEGFFLDAGFRFIYIPKIKWVLSSADGTRSRDWFHADNVVYSNFLFGFRWEF